MKRGNFPGIFRTVNFVSIITALPLAGVSANDTLEARLKALEGEVRARKVQVADLSAELRDLKAAPAVAVVTDQSSCEERVSALATKRAKLKDLGLSDKHPDVMNMTARLDELKATCKDE